MTTTILGNISARYLTYATVVLASGTILLCYILAVSYGHVPAWFPMISDCATQAPEKYPFRIGMICAAVAIGLNVWIISCFLKTVVNPTGKLITWSRYVGSIAAFGLSVVGAVNEDENNDVHSVGAGVFFVLYLVYQCMIIKFLMQHREGVHKHNYRVSGISIFWKIVATVGIIVFVVGLAICATTGHKIGKALCEWIAVFWVQVFNYSFAMDYGNAVDLSTDINTQFGGEKEREEERDGEMENMSHAYAHTIVRMEESNPLL